jgi:hypothetical protein
MRPFTHRASYRTHVVAGVRLGAILPQKVSCDTPQGLKPSLAACRRDYGSLRQEQFLDAYSRTNVRFHCGCAPHVRLVSAISAPLSSGTDAP